VVRPGRDRLLFPVLACRCRVSIRSSAACPDTSPGFSRGFGGWAARLNGKVLLTWDDKGCLGTYRSGFEEHFLRTRYRTVAWS
jgi:hypothetical protein